MTRHGMQLTALFIAFLHKKLSIGWMRDGKRMSTSLFGTGVKVFPASLDRLYDMLRFIHSNVVEVGFDESTASKIELACEEALVNIISYGFPDEMGYIEIDCSLTSSPGIKIQIRDRGIPFNPLNKAKSLNLPP